LELEEGQQSLDEFFDILTEVLMVEQDISEFSSMMEAVEKIIGALVTIADFSKAANIMARLRSFEEMMLRISPAPGSLQTKKAERTRQVIDQAGEEDKIRRITQILNEKEGLDLAMVKEYLFSLNLNSISSILHMLRELKEFLARRMVCEFLVFKGKSKLEIIREGLSDRNWYVIRNVIWVIGEIGSTEGVKYLKPLVYHLDFRIRREIITSLIKIPGPEAGALLVLFLDDDDKRIRSLACIGLSKRKESGALPKLNEILKDELFRDRSPDEKKHLLETYVAIAGNEAISLLVKMIEKRSWLKRDKHNETRIFAVGALGLIDSMEAKEALLSLSKKRNKVLKKACEDTLKRMELRQARGRESHSRHPA
jgi:HEAT repeat protein